mmetsp:Transcript_26676/g.56740  ORF Transcript_26676/g.56740 Transcript_26676/m.56740 type:complete len:186 (-) Transcript_26676:198-755(-)
MLNDLMIERSNSFSDAKHANKTTLMGMHSVCQLLGTALLLLEIQANAQEDVDGYVNYGRGSCQDQRGKQYSYLQRIMSFPNAETCGRQECERFGNSGAYRGFEFSVTKRCTCLFDIDEIPPVPNDANSPKYVSKMDNGNGAVTGVSGTPGAHCYQFARNSGVMAESAGGFYYATLLASAAFYMMF